MALEHTIIVPLRWRDIDALGHLNQAVYHELLEEGRSAFVADAAGIGARDWVMARVELDYRHEVRHDDARVEVRVRVGRIGARSITLEHDIVRPTGELAATGSSVLVAWDPDARTSRALTDDERAAFAG